jgi:hypothetical protein
LEEQIRTLDREIERLEQQQINKSDLKKVFKEFAGIYSEAPMETRRKLLNVIIEEVRCFVKRKEKRGEIVYKIRGDGSVKKNWEEAQKPEDPKPPSSGGSSLQVAWLREQDSNHRGRSNNADI